MSGESGKVKNNLLHFSKVRCVISFGKIITNYMICVAQLVHSIEPRRSSRTHNTCNCYYYTDIFDVWNALTEIRLHSAHGSVSTSNNGKMLQTHQLNACTWVTTTRVRSHSSAVRCKRTHCPFSDDRWTRPHNVHRSTGLYNTRPKCIALSLSCTSPETVPRTMYAGGRAQSCEVVVPLWHNRISNILMPLVHARP